jgi:hypothetical protein
LSASLERKLPGWRLVFGGGIDSINNVRSLTLMFYPEGQASSNLLTPLRHQWPE